MWQVEFYSCGWSSGYQVIRWTKMGKEWACVNHLGFPIFAKFQSKETAQVFCDKINNGISPDQAREEIIEK